MNDERCVTTMKDYHNRHIRAAVLLVAVFTLIMTGCSAQNTSSSEPAQPSSTAPASPDPYTAPPPSANDAVESEDAVSDTEKSLTTLLYQGHSSMRVTTPEGKIIYIDPYAGDGYDVPADLILVTHQHNDHNQLDLITTRNPDCEVFSNAEALKGGVHQTLSWDNGNVTVEATEAGNMDWVLVAFR